MDDLPNPRPNRTSEDLQSHLDNIAVLGFTIVSEVLDDCELEIARELLDRAYDSYDPAVDGLGRVSGYYFSANLVNKGAFFEELYLKQPIYGLVQELLGEDCILGSLNSLEPRHGKGNQGLHRDGGHPLSNRLTAMNSWWAVDDICPQNGSTRLVSGSHLNGESPRDMEDRAVQVTLAAGSAVVTNARIVHGACENLSGARRRVMHVYYLRHGTPQQTEQRRFLSRAVQERVSPLARKVLVLGDQLP